MAGPASEMVAREAARIYEQEWKVELEQSHRDEFVAIEPRSGDYFLGETWEWP